MLITVVVSVGPLESAATGQILILVIGWFRKRATIGYASVASLIEPFQIKQILAPLLKSIYFAGQGLRMQKNVSFIL